MSKGSLARKTAIGYFDAYGVKSEPKWMGKDSSWFDPKKSKSRRK